MDVAMWFGLGVVALGAGLGAFLMFGQHANPRAGTAPSTVGTLPPRAPAPTRPLSGGSGAAPARGGDVRIRWYQRVRSGLVLLLITVGLGMAIGAVLGAGALAVNLLLG